MTDRFPTPPKPFIRALTGVFDAWFDRQQAQVLARVIDGNAPDPVRRAQIDLPIADTAAWPTLSAAIRLPRGYAQGSLRFQARFFGDTASAGNIVYQWRAWRARIGSTGFVSATPDATRTDTTTVTATSAKIARDSAVWVPPLNLQETDVLRIVLVPGVSTYLNGVFVAGWTAYYEHADGPYSLTGIAQ